MITTISKTEIEELYIKHHNLRKIGEIYNTSPQTVSRLMDYYEIKRTINTGNKKHFFNEDYFNNIDDGNKAYWLGFIMADGCVYKGTNDTLRLQINLKYDDMSHLQKFQSSIGSDYSIQRKEVNNSVVAILKINSTKMCKDLIRHGVTERKSLTCTFPKISTSLYSHFIRGYFDGDGCIYMSINGRFRKEFSIVGNNNMISSISEILKVNKYNLKGREYLAEIKTSNNDSIFRIHDYLYSDANIFLKRKKKCYDILIYVLRCPLME
ncbi:MAG: helix-turn-helix domain-containing protein [Peptostreptococcaceae bacterium]